MAEVHTPHAVEESGNPSVHHETSDANVRGILMFAAALIVAAIVIHLLVWVLFRFMDAQQEANDSLQYPLAAQQETREPPEPRLQTNPREDLRELREQEHQVLSTYGWVDKNAGVVRIPIDEAMKRVVQQGLPARQQQGQAK
jgi:flagellar biosynthesis/type III secretory pathway M-ring protein FliF/YscJ